MCILLSQYLIEMTKIRLILGIAVTLLFSSCLEIKETYTLLEDGAYTMEYSVDMGNMIGLFQSMSEEAPAELAAFKPADTLINYKDLLPDSVKRQTDPKTLSFFENTSLKLKMDVSQGIFFTKINNQGKSTNDLRFLLENMDNLVESANKKVMNSFTPKKPNEEEYTGNNPALSNKDFEYIITPNSFERKLTADAIEKLKGRNMAEIENLLSDPEADFNIMSTLVINLPRPAKSIDNKNAILSADKKQFSLRVNLIKTAGNPEMLNFKIVY